MQENVFIFESTFIFKKGGLVVNEIQFKINEHMMNIMTCVHTHHCLHLAGQNLLETCVETVSIPLL